MGERRGVLMRRRAVAAVLGAALLLGTGCGRQSPSSAPEEADGVQLQVVRPVILTTEPLGDVVVDQLTEGQQVTGICLVAEAGTNAGVHGSSVRVRTETAEGFAATSTLQEQVHARRPIFDPDPTEPAQELRPCR